MFSGIIKLKCQMNDLLERTRLTVYVNKQQHRELKIFCANLGYSMSHFIDIAIREKIKKEIKKMKEKNND